MNLPSVHLSYTRFLPLEVLHRTISYHKSRTENHLPERQRKTAGDHPRPRPASYRYGLCWPADSPERWCHGGVVIEHVVLVPTGKRVYPYQA